VRRKIYFDNAQRLLRPGPGRKGVNPG